MSSGETISTNPEVPCTLLVFDEIQQFIGQDAQTALCSLG
jgi:hypothetical protein